MKKFLALVMASTLVMTALVGCGSEEPKETVPPVEETKEAPAEAPAEEPVEEPVASADPTDLVVVTTYGGDDGNRGNYEAAFKAYEEKTGNTVLDASGTANEEWKAKVMTDFEAGSEPDVLFYFTGIDSNKIIEGDKVVSLEEIRAEYPEYGSNMKDESLAVSPVDQKAYAIPVNGFWEGLFINEKVLADSGVEIPGADYTWDQFLADCALIKDAGYTPIAASLQEEPHYWFEFTTMNNGNLGNHLDIPASADDEAGLKWAAGFEDLTELYELGYFPENTLTATNAEATQMMLDDQAAFHIDGSWKMGWYAENSSEIDNFSVTFVPGKGERKATDMVGGLSSGYFITRRAWEDPAKRQAAVDFVMQMTTDEVVSSFGATAVTALKNGTIAPAELNSLEQSAIAMNQGNSGVVGAAQDGLNVEARADLFGNVQNMVTGGMVPADAITSAIALQ